MSTFMILVIIGVLIMAMMTANLGQVALATTNMANAADASALMLGSQLASKSNQLYESLDNDTEKCIATGNLGGILAIVFAVIATILTAGAASPALVSAGAGMMGGGVAVVGGGVAGVAGTIGIAAAAGAAGGAIGNAAIGLDPVKGAMDGAITGASIATASQVFGEIGATLGAKAGAAGAAAKAAEAPADAALLELPAGAAEETLAAEMTVPETIASAEAQAAAGGVSEGAVYEAAYADAMSTLGPMTPTLAGPGPVTLPAAAAATVPTAPVSTPVKNMPITQATAYNAAQGVAQAAGEMGPGFGPIMDAAYASALPMAETGSAIGSAAGVAFNTATKLYTETVKQQARADAIAGATKILNGLPVERDRIARGVIFDAFSRVVDDPTKSRDDYDIDGDGNKHELVPKFLNWWYERNVGMIDRISKVLIPGVNGFVTGPLKAMRHNAKEAISGVLAREVFEGRSGELEELLRILWREPRYRSALEPFWDPSPTRAEREQWADRYADCDESCEDVPAPPGWDEVDLAVERLGTFAGVAEAIQVQDTLARVRNWQEKLGDATDLVRGISDGDGQAFALGIEGWRRAIRDIRQALPACRQDPVLAGQVTNPPCQDLLTGRATSDEQIMNEDEFAVVESKLRALQAELDQFLDSFKELLKKMEEETPAWGAERTLRNVIGIALEPLLGFSIPYPAEEHYAWDDSRGHHVVRVVVGPFPLPDTKVETRGSSVSGEICIVMKEYKDTSGLRTFVMINRTDTPDRLDTEEKETWKLGLWNWNGGKTELSTTRFASVKFSYNAVNLGAVQLVGQKIAQQPGMQKVFEFFGWLF